MQINYCKINYFLPDLYKYEIIRIKNTHVYQIIYVRKYQSFNKNIF